LCIDYIKPPSWHREEAEGVWDAHGGDLMIRCGKDDW
jgi:hypothetical protein